MLTIRYTFLAVCGIFAMSVSALIACDLTDQSNNDTDDTQQLISDTNPSGPMESELLDLLSTSTPIPKVTITPVTEENGMETPEFESVTFYLQAYNAMGRNEYVDAERTFTTVIELEPNFARGWDGRGQALLLQGKFEEAMLDFDKAIELKPNLTDAYANRALTRIAIDDDDGAERDAFRAYELDQSSVVAHIVLGRVHAKKGDFDGALNWFGLAIETDAEDASTWWWRGRFYRDVLGAGNLALDDFNMAIELSPAQAALYLDRGQLYVGAQVDPALARADLEEAISLSQDPKLPAIISRAEELIAVLDEREGPVQ